MKGTPTINQLKERAGESILESLGNEQNRSCGNSPHSNLTTKQLQEVESPNAGFTIAVQLLVRWFSRFGMRAWVAAPVCTHRDKSRRTLGPGNPGKEEVTCSNDSYCFQVNYVFARNACKTPKGGSGCNLSPLFASISTATSSPQIFRVLHDLCLHPFFVNYHPATYNGPTGKKKSSVPWERWGEMESSWGDSEAYCTRNFTSTAG